MGYMYPITTMYPIPKSPLNLNFRQNPSTYMESSHNTPIIHAFNLDKKDFFIHLKVLSEWGTL